MLWACGAHNRWQREPSPRRALKLSTQACRAHSPHTSGPVAAAQGGPSPSTPRRPLSSRCPRQAGRHSGLPPRASRRPPPALPFSRNRAGIYNGNTLIFCKFESLAESGLLTGGSVPDTADSSIPVLLWVKLRQKTAPLGTAPDQGCASSSSLEGEGSSLQGNGLRGGRLGLGRGQGRCGGPC